LVLFVENAGEGPKAELRRGISGVVGERPDAGDGPHVDNAAAAGAKEWKHRLGDEKSAGEIRVENGSPLVEREIRQGLEDADTGIIQNGVQTTVAFANVADERLHGSRVTNVERLVVGVGRRERSRSSARSDDDGMPIGGERASDGGADASGSAGNEKGFRRSHGTTRLTLPRVRGLGELDEFAETLQGGFDEALPGLGEARKIFGGDFERRERCAEIVDELSQVGKRLGLAVDRVTCEASH
jgi:hypothetical protein